MFLVELSYNTIKEEIDDLDNKGKKKEIALEDSKKQLESDHLKLIKFIEQDNVTTTDKEREAEKVATRKKKKE